MARIILVLILIFVIIGISLSHVIDCPARCSCKEKEISCVNCNLALIPEINTADNPYKLDLADNELEEVTLANFASPKVRQLHYLFLNSNNIVDIEETSFRMLLNLELLDLSNNMLSNVPSQMIKTNSKLQELSLFGNLFSYDTPELISDSLQVLNLAFSQISTFTEKHIKHLPNLRFLYLEANSLKQIDYKMFSINNNIKFVSLSFNSWECNCNTVKVFDYLVSNNMTTIDRPVQCMYPNKWYEDIYNSEGSLFNKPCGNKTQKTFTATNVYSVIKLENKTNESNKETYAAPPESNKTTLLLSRNLAKEDILRTVEINIPNATVEEKEIIFVISYSYIIIGAVLVSILLIIVAVAVIIILRFRKPKNTLYEQLSIIDKIGTSLSSKQPDMNFP